MNPGWQERLLDSTRGRIVQLLRRKSRTVTELAEALQVTDNAVRAQLAGLERDGLVRQSGLLKGARKPFQSYALTESAESLFPKGYGLLLREVLTALVERDGRDRVEDVLREVGRRLAVSHAGRLSRLTLRERLDAAVDILADLGGLAEIEEHDSRVFLQGYSCPFADAMPGHPEVCSLAESFLSAVLGCPVVDRCHKESPPKCRFEVGDPGQDDSARGSLDS